MVELKEFVKNYRDLSDDNGFQFEFFCDRCGNGYKSQYKSYTLAKVSSALSMASKFLGDIFGKGADVAKEAKSFQWHSEHDKAFFEAVEAAKPHFHRCPGCQQWVCFKCWNDEASLCLNCAPRLVTETAKLKTKSEIEAAQRYFEEKVRKGGFIERVKKAEQTTVVCPNCGKPTRPGKFCELCGAPLTKRFCPNCGAEVSLNARFCSNCGAKLK